jgi:hypothetical protein
LIHAILLDPSLAAPSPGAGYFLFAARPDIGRLLDIADLVIEIVE